jgi:hypothetical protein
VFVNLRPHILVSVSRHILVHVRPHILVSLRPRIRQQKSAPYASVHMVLGSAGNAYIIFSHGNIFAKSFVVASLCGGCLTVCVRAVCVCALCVCMCAVCVCVCVRASVDA